MLNKTLFIFIRLIWILIIFNKNVLNSNSGRHLITKIKENNNLNLIQ